MVRRLGRAVRDVLAALRRVVLRAAGRAERRRAAAFRLPAAFFAVFLVFAPPRRPALSFAEEAALRADDLDRPPPSAFRLAVPVLRLAIAIILSRLP
jgi:hypothetical protein